MRAVIQRVSRASVRVDGEVVAEIGAGLALLVAVEADDAMADVDALAAKVAGLRVFPDDKGRMGRSVVDIGGETLVVSQFTLMADLRRGRRPSFSNAASPSIAAPLIDALAERLAAHGVPSATGSFGAMMEVSLVNDGPVTFVIDVRSGSVV